MSLEGQKKRSPVSDVPNKLKSLMSAVNAFKIWCYKESSDKYAADL